MPFSADNPNRNRNFVILALCLTTAFTVVIGAYVALSLAERDTTEFYRFLALLVGSLIPSVIGAWRANTAAKHSAEAVVKTEEIAETLNGGREGEPGLNERMRQANRDVNEEVRREGEDGRSTV